MFYCEACQKKNNWVKASPRSYGHCEICNEPGDCYDVPSSYLPALPKNVMDIEDAVRLVSTVIHKQGDNEDNDAWDFIINRLSDEEKK